MSSGCDVYDCKTNFALSLVQFAHTHTRIQDDDISIVYNTACADFGGSGWKNRKRGRWLGE
jgi:hypothetical protein